MVFPGPPPRRFARGSDGREDVMSDAVETYAIPSGSMSAALTAFAEKNRLHLLYDARTTRRLTSPGLVGRHSLREDPRPASAIDATHTPLLRLGNFVTIFFLSMGNITGVGRTDRHSSTRSANRRHYERYAKNLGILLKYRCFLRKPQLELGGGQTPIRII